MIFNSRLLRTFDYLRIKHEAKVKYDFWLPLGVALALVVAIEASPAKIPIFGPTGIVAAVNGLISILAGFFIASLAAVATFNKSSMDNVMPGKPPVLDVYVRGVTKKLELTRRRFLSLMFGYLAMMSISVYLIGAFGDVLAFGWISVLPIEVAKGARSVFLFGYFFMFANILTTTLLGLFFMVDRIHRPDPDVKKVE